MKEKIFLSILSFFLISAANAQQEEQKIFTKVENEANTNPKAWAEHITKNIQLPDSALQSIPPGTYKVIVKFIIDKHGEIGQVKVKSDPGYGLAQRAVKIISNYNGKWQPAIQCGRAVSAYREQPITFIVPSNNQPNL